MQIEHFAYVMKDPVAAAAWYATHLKMRVLRKLGAPTWTHFIADSSGRAVIEIYNNPAVSVPDYFQIDPLVLHLAFQVEDVNAARQRLLLAGASVVGEIMVTDTGDELAMLRDPWGFAIQLVKRKEAMLPA